VRRQVCKRLKQRIGEFGLYGFAAYRRRLEVSPAEWRAFDECCHITISRFLRDKHVFEVLRKRFSPTLPRGLPANGARLISGSPDVRQAKNHTPRRLSGTRRSHGPFQVHACQLSRPISIAPCSIALAGGALRQQICANCCNTSLIKRSIARGAVYCIKPRYREGIEFLHQDLRSEAPDRLFDLILCRYVAYRPARTAWLSRHRNA
jgi:chemotaxis protein methyltransferase CheR